jgi:tetratricopeptide (TPR) repeat protein
LVAISGGPDTLDTWDAGHPDAETLAAYVDRTLAVTARLAVERHASECADCRDVLADTAALVESEGGAVVEWPRSPFRPWMAIGVASGLAAAAAVFLLVNGGLRGGSTRTAELDELVAAYAGEPNRPAEGRLSGGFPYAPAPSVVRGGGGTDLSPDVRIAVARIESAAASDRSARSLWALGVAHLASGTLDLAVQALEEAARLDATNAELHSDVSAAYLARGRDRGDNGDLERALAAADRALTSQSDLPEALFNRALALAALQRPEAAAAWRAVEAREAGSPWAKEAAQRSTDGRPLP